MQTVLFRADGNARIGAGHIMRCLSLAQAVIDCGGQATILSEDLAEGFRKRLEQEIPVHDLGAEPYGEDDAVETIETAEFLEATWVVIDGYAFDEDYIHTLKDAGLKVLRFDDYNHLGNYQADILLNQNAHVDPSKYSQSASDSTLLMGSSYTVLQRDFRNTQPNGEVADSASRILVTLGGSDPDNLTPTVISALKDLDVELTVVVGGGNTHLSDVEAALKGSGVPGEIVVNADNMHELMQQADMAITAAGSTCYELAYMGVPMITMTVAENQMGVAAGLEAGNACVHLGWKTDVTESQIADATAKLLSDQKKRSELQKAGKSLIDGSGVWRVLRTMEDSPLYLRPATGNDCKMVFEWANDSETRAASFSSDEIPWEDHEKWYEARMNDAKHLFYIGMTQEEQPLGQVRFAIEGDRATISVSIDPDMRGKKYAVPLITLGCGRCFGEGGVKQIDAYIKPENEASKAVFEKVGFTESDPTEFDGNPALHFILQSS